MGVEVIARRHLSFDVGNGKESPDPYVHALRNLGKVKLAIERRHIVAIRAVLAQQLIAEDSLHDGVAIIEAIDVGDIESPVDAIPLRRIREPLDAENELIELDPV